MCFFLIIPVLHSINLYTQIFTGVPAWVTLLLIETENQLNGESSAEYNA